MKNHSMHDDMQQLLAQSEEKVRQLGSLVTATHASSSGDTERLFRQAEVIRQEIMSLTQLWYERYDLVYNQTN